MKYGLIGEHLGHSFSKLVHGELADYDYDLCEIKPEKLNEFLENKDFLGINVTIPYKEKVIPKLDTIDDAAVAIGAVNTIVNRAGKLSGYNTDFYGMSELIKHAGVEVKNKKAAILGSGGTSKTAFAVLNALGAREMLRVSRSAKDGAITYDDLYAEHRDIEIIINTTPSGMYPNNDDAPIVLSRFEKLCGVIDAIYNPLRTKLILSAKERGIAAEGGLYMLIAQAVRASEIFLGVTYPDGMTESVYDRMIRDKENIVLIGMPASGKSTVGAILAKELCRELIDTDALIVEREGMAISDIFAKHGEAYFRDVEAEVVREASKTGGKIISTGGGAILRRDSVRALSENGRIYFIDRPLSALVPTDSRPLSSDRTSIEKRYHERYDIYKASCDVIIDADCDAMNVAKKITENFKK